MKTQLIARFWQLPGVALLVLASACADDPVAVRPAPDAGLLTGEYECTVDVSAGTTHCRPASSQERLNGPRLDLLLTPQYATFVNTGGGVNLRGNAADEDTTILNWALKNKMLQPIGTTDGSTADPRGSRLIFNTVWVSAVKAGTSLASATIRLGNPDGIGDGATPYPGKPYYAYMGVLKQDSTSPSKPLEFIYSSSVTTFRYSFIISSPVQYEHGWITIAPSTASVLAPGGMASLTGTVYNAFGVVQGDGISWASSNTAVATVDASGTVTGVGEGTATITATSTVDAQRNGTIIITVDAAPTVVGTTPTDGAAGVTAGGDIVVQFSEPVSVSGSGFVLECPTGSSQAFVVSGSGTDAITLNPDGDLPAATTCTVTVVAAQVSDVDTHDGPNTMSANYVFSFESGIKANDDVFGEIIYGMINTATTSPPFSVTANDQINASTTIGFAGWNGVPGKTRQGGDVVMVTSGAGRGHFTYDPPAGYAGVDSLEYTVQDGYSTSTAKVALIVDADAAPAVDSTSPIDGATDAAPGGPIVVHFTEPVNVLLGSFVVACTSGGHFFTISGSGTSTVTLSPTTSLQTGDTCTVTVLAAGVSDVDTNDGADQLAENHSFWFVVDGFGG